MTHCSGFRYFRTLLRIRWEIGQNRFKRRGLEMTVHPTYVFDEGYKNKVLLGFFESLLRKIGVRSWLSGLFCVKLFNIN